MSLSGTEPLLAEASTYTVAPHCAVLLAGR